MNKLFVLSLFFFSFLAWTANEKSSTYKSNKTSTQKIKTEEKKIEEDFVPSLSKTLHDTNRQKHQIQKQLTKNITDDLKNENPERRPAKSPLTRETADFGDLEVTISERVEEDIKEIRLKK